jgi:predicted nucleic acid-binding protein
MTNLVVLYDSCVLYPAPLRDLLMHLALTDLFRAKWTDAIHEEWIRNVLINRPDLTKEQLNRTRDLMNIHVRDCLVIGYEKITPTLSLPDPNDHHVLAAAISASASTIVTYNLKDFPSRIVGRYEIEVQHPDEFIAQLIDHAPGIVCSAIRHLRPSLKNPPINAENYLNALERQALPRTVNKLREFVSLI